MHYTKMIKKKGSFKFLINKGNHLKGEFLSLYYRKNSNNYNTFGVCVSKKNGNSVKRNKIKRWVREVYKLNEYNLGKGTDIVIIVKKNVLVDKLNYILVKSDMETLISKVN